MDTPIDVINIGTYYENMEIPDSPGWNIFPFTAKIPDSKLFIELFNKLFIKLFIELFNKLFILAERISSMKKTFTMLLITLMLLSLTSCGRSKESAVSNPAVTDSAIENSTDTQEETSSPSQQESSSDSQTENILDSQTDEFNEVDSETVGQILLKDFQDKVNNADTALTAEELAQSMISNPVIAFQGAVMPVEEGLLTGFDNAEITGFKEGAMFAPSIGTIPFVGYIFVLDENADTDAFVQTLKDNANLRWNICTAAEELIAEPVGNTIFFLMSPRQLGE